ncbi:MAG: ABC transporter permease [Clostridia bacterium]|nr:ABC transporter permease [Clostridia bacterium]
MKTNDVLRLALLFLARRKVRTLLTVLGVVIGTVCIVLMLSVGISSYEGLQGTIESRSALTEIRVLSESGGLRTGDIEEISQIKHVKAVSPLLSLPGRLSTGTYEAFVTLTGVLPDVLELEFAEGGMFPAAAGSRQLVVGGNAVREFVDPRSPPDYRDWEAWEAYSPDIQWLEAEFAFRFGYGAAAEEEEEPGSQPEEPVVPMRVCGVTERTENAESGSIYIDLEAARQILMDNVEQAEAAGLSLNSCREVLVRVESMDCVEGVLHQIRERGFEAVSDIEYIHEMRSEQGRQLLQLLMIGLVSLLVSAIGIANTMYAGILERRRDIGIMKVLGMKRARVQALFVTEAACLGVLGGLIGLGLSAAALSAVNAGMHSGTLFGMSIEPEGQISIPFWVGAGAVLTACGTGILAGLWPASRAARMSPLEAMRQDR